MKKLTLTRFIGTLSLFICATAAQANCEVPYSYEEMKDMSVKELYDVFCPVARKAKEIYNARQYANGHRLDILLDAQQTCNKQEERLERLLKKKGERMWVSDVHSACGMQ